jgi:hypothetical protein
VTCPRDAAHVLVHFIVHVCRPYVRIFSSGFSLIMKLWIHSQHAIFFATKKKAKKGRKDWHLYQEGQSFLRESQLISHDQNHVACILPRCPEGNLRH